jgi:uncharacterized repeat protein (TIGR01451 family)/CSLREA domain-containing protein
VECKNVSMMDRRFERISRMTRYLAVALICSMALVTTVSARPIVVTTLEDGLAPAGGGCSLRAAMVNANNGDQSGSVDCESGNSGSDQIVFDDSLEGGTLLLSLGELPVIVDALEIIGTARSITIDADNKSRVFRIEGGSPSAFEVNLADLTITNGFLDGAGEHGGAIFVDQADLALERVVVSDSVAAGDNANGGGIHVTQGDLNLNRARIADNMANGTGGGISVASGQVFLSRTRITGNNSQGSGGGLRVTGGTTQIERSEISGNTASGASGAGGGVSVHNSETTIVNSTLSGNFSESFGGAVFVHDTVAEITHTTFASNDSNNGGATLHINGSSSLTHVLTLNHSLVAMDEEGNTACGRNVSASFEPNGVISNHASCSGSVGTTLADIAIGPLANHGGGTHTHALLAGSVAINAGSDCSANYGIGTDQRGHPRPGGSSQTCDVGSYEDQTVIVEADLSIEKTVNPVEAKADEIVVFTIQASNLGPDAATSVSVIDQLPSGYALVDWTADHGSYEPDSGIWSIGELAVDDPVVLNIEAQVQASGDHLNQAAISGDQDDPDPSNNEDEALVVLIEEQADLSIEKSVEPAAERVGRPVEFTLVVDNHGPDGATGVVVSDQLPAGYAYVGSEADTGSYDESTGIWTVGNLASEQSAALVITATINIDGPYLNTATVTADQADPDGDNNSAEAAVEVLPPPDGPMVVDTLDDVVANDGWCSLREAIINANNNDQSGSVDCAAGQVGSDTILFDAGLAGGTIVLNGSELPLVLESLVIEGPVSGDPAGITIDADHQSRVLTVNGELEFEMRDLTLTGGRVTGAAIGGGAVHVTGADSVFERVLITGNASEGGNGGGVMVVNGSATLIDSEITVNTAKSGGGLSSIGSTVVLTGSTVTANHATDTGAGGLSLGSSDSTLVNSTVSGNTSDAPSGAGGGIFVSSGDATLIHTTVAFNSTAGTTQDVFVRGVNDNPGAVYLFNSLVVHAAGSQACGQSFSNSTIESAGSLSTDSRCADAATPLEDFGLGALTDNGGPTNTHALSPGSVAINAAGSCLADYGVGADQRGQKRPGLNTPACDVGAFELQVVGGDVIFRSRFSND